MAEPNAEGAGSAPANQTLGTANQAAVVGSAPDANAAPAANQAANSANASVSESEGVLGEKGRQEVITLRKRAQTAEQEAAYFRGLAEGNARQPSANQAPVAPAGPPDQSQFENWDDYLVAKAKYEFRQEQAQQSRNNRVSTNQTRFQQDLAKAAEQDPDIMRAVRMAPAPTPAMTDAILESDASAAIAIHLATHPDEYARIRSLPSEYAQAREIGKLEAKLSASPAPAQVNHISQAPEPLKPVGGGGESQTTDLENVSMEEFAARRNAEQFGRRK